MSYKDFLEHHTGVLRSLRYETGLFAASQKNVSTGYEKAWLRDNIYVSFALDALGDREALEAMYAAILSIFLKHEWKIDYAILAKPQFGYQYIHPRYHPETFDEYWEVWGNKQNDAVGSLLFALGTFVQKGMTLIDTDDKHRIVQKLIQYLSAIEYWHDVDSGIWEEDEEIHASSLGACVAGLKKIQEVGFDVPLELIEKGEDMLHHELLPRESHRKFCDLALLTLLYPYNLLHEEEARQILGNIEYHLVKEKGVIRYKGDRYYNHNWDSWSEEAEWTFGFSFLSLLYFQMGDRTKSEAYLKKAISTVNEKGDIPELYYSHTSEHNENSPLVWSEAMFLAALKQFV